MSNLASLLETSTARHPDREAIVFPAPSGDVRLTYAQVNGAANQVANLLVSRGIPCAGPITVAGCGARCPGYNVPCIGCRGPVDEANFRSWKAILQQCGVSEEDLRRSLRTFAGRQVQDDSIGAA